MSADSKPHWRTVIKRIDPAYLYAEDLGPAGTKVDVDVTAAGIGKVRNPGGAKEVVWIGFAGYSKKLGLNATNAKTMEAVFGSPHWGDWRGWITLVVIHKDAMRDPTADGGTSPMDVIRIAPTRPTKPRSQTREHGEHPLVSRLDGCTTREQFDATYHDMRAVWSQIPKGADRSAVGAAFDRAKARVRAAQSSSGDPPPEEQAEILRQEASEQQ